MQKIDIELRPSKIFMGLMAGIVVGCLALIASLSIGWLLKVALIISVVSYGWWIAWVDVLLKGADSILGIQLLADGSCQVRYPLGVMAAEIKGDSTVTTVVSVLRFNVQDKRKVTSVIFKDSIGQEKYRQLLVWLKCFPSSQ